LIVERRNVVGETRFPNRLHELEQEFTALSGEIPESPEKRALSVLHGIVMEVWRNLERKRATFADRGPTVDEVADLWRSAPAMQGEAVNAPLAPGTEAPDFALPDASGQLVRLTDFRGRPVVLVFYPLDWSPGCSQQLDLYQQEIEEFRKRDAQILAVSVDSIYSHGAWAAVRGIEFPLLADFHPKGEIAKQYSVWREQDGFSERALYVIDAEGVIRYSHVSPYLHHVPDLDELLEAVDETRLVTA
jgi:peroxiredoxin